MLPRYPGHLLALAILLLASCRSAPVAYYCRPQATVVQMDTVAAPAALLPAQPTPPLPPAPAKKAVAATPRRLAAPLPRRAKRLLLAGGRRLAQRWRQHPRLVWQPAEVQYLDDTQRNGLTLLLVGGAITALGWLLLALLVGGGGGTLGSALLVLLVYYGGLITLAVGVVLLLVGTLFKLVFPE